MIYEFTHLRSVELVADFLTLTEDIMSCDIEDDRAKVAGASGSAATTAGIGALAAGSSAAEITTALATLGSVVGGGMASGIVLVAAAPLAVGGAIYGLCKLFSD